MKKEFIIERPSVAEVEKGLKQWRDDSGYENYRRQEESVVMLFKEAYPRNTDLREVLIKVGVLNDFYGTNIFSVYPVARHIVDLKIDARLADADLGVVDSVSRVNRDGKEIRYYSFASKYCSHHRPDVFPIYDRYVDRVLTYFKAEFYLSANPDLKDYASFRNVILEFRKYYGLEKFTLRELDLYLWVLGKKTFPPPPKKNKAQPENQ